MTTHRLAVAPHSGVRAAARGFTLVELMLVVVVVVILAAVALPGWQDQMRKGRRANAKALLQEIAGLQERFFTANNTYADTFAKLGYTATPKTSDNAYAASIAAAGGGFANGVAITATLQSGFTDPQCGNLTLSSTGARTTSVSPGTGCW